MPCPDTPDVPATWIDAGTHLSSDEEVNAFLARGKEKLSRRPRSIGIDLSRVRTSNSMSIAALIWLVGRCEDSGVTLEIVSSPEIHRWLQVCRVAHVLERPLALGNAPGARPPSR